jgi:hypothetical protein
MSPPDAGGEGGVRATGALLALEATTGMPEIDARFVQETEAALARGAWQTLGALALTGGRRGVPGVLAVAERVLAMAEHEPAAEAIAVDCAQALQSAGRLRTKWFVTALGRPSSPLCAIAAEVVCVGAKPGVVLALQRALGDGARGGRSAAAAAKALVMTGESPADDPRLDGILERAPERECEELVSALLDAGAPLSTVRRHCARLLLSRDERIAIDVFVTLERFARGAEMWDLMESVMALGPTGEVRESIEHYLGAPSEAETYWRELGDEDDEPV